MKGEGADTYFLGSAINVSKEDSEDVMDCTPHTIPEEMQTFLIGVINNKKSVTIDRQELKERSGEKKSFHCNLRPKNGYFFLFWAKFGGPH